MAILVCLSDPQFFKHGADQIELMIQVIRKKEAQYLQTLSWLRGGSRNSVQLDVEQLSEFFQFYHSEVNAKIPTLFSGDKLMDKSSISELKP